MRIAILQPDRHGVYGGAQRVLENVIPRLALRHVVAYFGFASVLESPVETHLTRWQEDGIVPRRFGLFSERKSVVNLMEAVDVWSPDVILLNNHADLAAWISKRADVPTLFYAHDVNNLERLGRPDGPGFRDRYRRSIALRSSDFGRTKLVICVSHFVEAEYKNRFPRLETKVIYNGVDHSVFRPSGKDGGFGLCASRLSRKKNLSLLRDAFGKTSYPVVLLGDANAKGSDPVEDLIGGSGVMFDQFLSRDQLVDKMRSCSFFVNPGRNEGFSMATLEAMACGKPVLAHNSGGTPEVAGDAGLLMGDDPRQWRAKADELMSSEEMRREVGRRAHEHSLYFSWDKTVAQLEEALMSLGKS